MLHQCATRGGIIWCTFIVFRSECYTSVLHRVAQSGILLPYSYQNATLDATQGGTSV